MKAILSRDKATLRHATSSNHPNQAILPRDQAPRRFEQATLPFNQAIFPFERTLLPLDQATLHFRQAILRRNQATLPDDQAACSTNLVLPRSANTLMRMRWNCHLSPEANPEIGCEVAAYI